ncbi:hypothetical protein EVAR_79589_1 [Eumeta japonica]|uniref:Uncharacterized protein n=1 Tax=Eumeta variegata TaxID=151549 RepID=A0A4C1UFJ2_EUMVA|nr:hypothetical protein EVAR_79589_1 [Eumeta japonica]
MAKTRDIAGTRFAFSYTETAFRAQFGDLEYLEEQYQRHGYFKAMLAPSRYGDIEYLQRKEKKQTLSEQRLLPERKNLDSNTPWNTPATGQGPGCIRHESRRSPDRAAKCPQ